MLLPNFIRHARALGYQRSWIATILLIQLLAVVFEGIGIGLVLPVLEYMNAGGNVEQLAEGSRLWQWMLDLAVGLGLPLNLPVLLGSVFLAILIRQVFLYVRDVYTASVQYEMMRRIRNAGFRGYIYAGLGYHDRVRAGDFVNELTTELARAASAMTAAVTFLAYLLLCAAYITIVFLLSVELTLMALGVLIIAAAMLIRLMNRIRDLGTDVTSANQDMSTFLVERLKSVRLVRLSGIEAGEEASLAERTQAQRNRMVAQRKLIALLSVLIEPIVLAIAFVLLYLSVTTFAMEFEAIILFFFVLVRLVPIMKEAVMLRQGYLGSLASVEVVERRLDGLGRAKDPVGGSRKLERIERGITLQDVAFHYGAAEDTGKPAAALSGVSLDIPANRMTALVGPSGAGKSTLVDLLPRLRTAQEGRILFDGVPQEEFETASLRTAISFAPQAPQIFNVTVAEHIRYGLRDASPEDIRAAARLAQAADFIEALPDGYQTLLGEGGNRLSGGQKQRLDLARALVRRAPILILDEPTSNLDAEAEALFREAIEQVRHETDMTIIVIGHRLSTVMGADQIVVMDAGRVVEQGRHSELLTRGAWYARAFASQQGSNSAAGAAAFRQ